MIIGSMSGALNQDGIETEIRNDILDGGAGEIAPGDAWIALWAVNSAQADAATLRIKEILDQPKHGDWLCHRCQESHPITFDVCC